MAGRAFASLGDHKLFVADAALSPTADVLATVNKTGALGVQRWMTWEPALHKALPLPLASGGRGGSRLCWSHDGKLVAVVLPAAQLAIITVEPVRSFAWKPVTFSATRSLECFFPFLLHAGCRALGSCCSARGGSALDQRRHRSMGCSDPRRRLCCRECLAVDTVPAPRDGARAPARDRQRRELCDVGQRAAPPSRRREAGAPRRSRGACSPVRPPMGAPRPLP
jgi:hypothetical protein